MRLLKINIKLKEIIERRGIKQIFICQKTGMTADTISRIINNTRKMTAEEFLNICEALGIDPNEFRQTA